MVLAVVSNAVALLGLLLAAVVPAAVAMSFGGYCTRCGTHHTLPTTEAARKAAVDLRDRMVRSGRIDIDELSEEHRRRLLSSSFPDTNNSDDTIGNPAALELGLDPSLAVERLYERRGKMFGVLVCEKTGGSSNSNGNDTVVLKAYAGKLGGQWNLPGWAPLVGKVPETIPEFNRLSADVTDLFRAIEGENSKEGGGDPETIRKLTQQRALVSTRAVEQIREHQILTNPRGVKLPIAAAFARGPTKLPGGTGDCAAPKLLVEAMRVGGGLRPTGICEIFVGATGGMSTTKQDGTFYDACEPRCQQIAGFLLCGLEAAGTATAAGGEGRKLLSEPKRE
eukprot:jgi/Psemu1/4303/gm1.4303_g